MVAMHGGKDLFFSTYKRRCPERDNCKSFATECEAPTEIGQVNHLIVSSEPLQGDNVWEPLAPGEIVAVDARMRLSREHAEHVHLAVHWSFEARSPAVAGSSTRVSPLLVGDDQQIIFAVGWHRGITFARLFGHVRASEQTHGRGAHAG